MPTRNDMTGGTIYISSADGKVWKAFEGIKEAAITCSDAINEFSREYKDLLNGNFEFTAHCKISNENKAVLLGFKNYNCYSRYIRRMKRKKEQERRRILKEGYFHA